MATKTLSTIMIIVICILLFPIGIGILGGMFGLVVGLAGGLFGAIVGIFGAMFGLVAGFFGWIFDTLFNWNFHWFDINFTTVLLIILIILVATRAKSKK